MADKNRTGLDWADLRVFVALARHGSLSATARALAVNHATVARRIAALERGLGERLVERRPDGYVLTAAGSRALAPAHAMEEAAATLRRGGADAGPAGLVRISATPGLAQAFLVARLAALMGQQPGLELELTTDVRRVSLERREADIALRLARPREGDLIARRLVTVGFGFYAAAGWRQRIAAGEAPRFVGFDEANADLPEAVWLARYLPGCRVVFRSDNQFMQAAAARAGAGIALLAHVIGRADDGLRPCPLAHAPPARELWLLMRRQDGKHPAIRVAADFLTRIFQDQAGLFA